MKKFTRRFNNNCARFSFWEALERHCAEFENLLQPREYLTDQDRQLLRELHGKIFECWEIMKSQKIFYWEKLSCRKN